MTEMLAGRSVGAVYRKGKSHRQEMLLGGGGDGKI